MFCLIIFFICETFITLLKSAKMFTILIEKLRKRRDIARLESNRLLDMNERLLAPIRRRKAETK